MEEWIFLQGEDEGVLGTHGGSDTVSHGHHNLNVSRAQLVDCIQHKYNNRCIIDTIIENKYMNNERTYVENTSIIRVCM